ncbi:MAG: SGNH/GDSL hydrolase family protein [Pseudomonadota bacterium]
MLRVIPVLLLAVFARPLHAEPGSFPPGTAYVAMGSSFAAGPGLGAMRADIDPRCYGSIENYPHKLARLRGFELTDVSCSGAQTIHVLNAWKELPAQLDAVGPGTQLVTITIGGNDLGYIGGLIQASCAAAGPNPASTWGCRDIPPAPTEAEFQIVEQRLSQILKGIAARAPDAHAVFVTYATVLPAYGLCAQAPLTPEQAALARTIAAKLEAITRRVAEAAQATLVDAAALSRLHHACADIPWMTGYLDDGGVHEAMPYHPNDAGMDAIAEAIAAALPLQE